MSHTNPKGASSKVGLSKDILNLHEAGMEALRQYLLEEPIYTGYPKIDNVLQGGLEVGNYYLFLGAAKSGKSTTLRALGMKLAEKYPVLYLNFEQLGKNVYAKIYQLKYGESIREECATDLPKVVESIARFPDIPFYIGFWPDELTDKGFNTSVRGYLESSIKFISENDPQHRKPVIIMENLSDIYNERLHQGDSLANIVTQTAQDVKNFAIYHQVAILLAHHCAKLAKGQKTPSMDDVRDSKRVVDLAHSIFANFVRESYADDGQTVVSSTRHLAYLAGRGQSEGEVWRVAVSGLEMNLV